MTLKVNEDPELRRFLLNHKMRRKYLTKALPIKLVNLHSISNGLLVAFLNGLYASPGGARTETYSRRMHPEWMDGFGSNLGAMFSSIGPAGLRT
jgi:hypothetical protein